MLGRGDYYLLLVEILDTQGLLGRKEWGYCRAVGAELQREKEGRFLCRCHLAGKALNTCSNKRETWH